MNVQAWIAEAKTTRRKRIVLRPIGPTIACQTAIEQIIAGLLRAAYKQATDAILPAAISARSDYVRDSLGWFKAALDAFRGFIDGLVEGIREPVESTLKTESKRHSRRFNESLRSAIGIDLGASIAQRGFQNAIELAVQRNVALVRGLSQDLTKRLESTLLDGITRGLSSKALADIITAEFGFSRKRARLIARDQVASFNGELNRLSQIDIGVTEYEWSTSNDERVRGRPDGRWPNSRPSHWDREGKVFKWSSPPSDGHPGAAVNCRCSARAILEFNR